MAAALDLGSSVREDVRVQISFPVLFIIMIKSEIFICPICKKEFVLEGRKLKDAKQNIKNGKAGPFCCKRCAGIYGKRVQIGIK